MKFAVFIAVTLVSFGSTAALASDQDEFCFGFSEGFKSIKGDMALVPLCPLAPLTPLGTTPLREGILAGINAASK